MKKIVVSGVQASGNLHLGNYIGSIRNWVKMQDDYDCLFFLADLHSITLPIDPKDLKSSVISCAALYLASGIKETKSTIFLQSQISAHSELAWILNCVTPLGWLKRMTQFKDKSGKDEEKICLGLLSYPVLMAADILLYNADLVPVGDDQKQHLEITRDIAGLINRKFNNEIFKIPEPLIQNFATRIMSLKDGTKKMSKSDISDFSRINLNDEPDLIRDKIKKAKTDNIAEITYDKENRPEISNLIEIYSALTETTIKQIIDKYHDCGFAKFKNDLSDLVIAFLEPINNKYNDLIKNQDHLLNILNKGSIKAKERAEKQLHLVKSNFGFIG